MGFLRNTLERILPQSTTDEYSDAPIEKAHAKKALLSRTLAGTVTASDDAIMTLSGALVVRAGGDLIVNGGGAFIVTGDELTMQSSGAAAILAREAQIESGLIGVLLSGNTRIGNNARVLINTRQAIIIGVSIGILYPLVRYLLQRFAPPPQPPEPADQPVLVGIGRWLIGALLRIGITALIIFLTYRWVRSKLSGLLGRE